MSPRVRQTGAGLALWGMSAVALGAVAEMGGCAAKQRQPREELEAAPLHTISTSYDDGYSAAVHAALDAGYTPSAVDREKGEFAAWAIGRFDPDKPGQAAMANAASFAGSIALTMGAVALSLLSGGHGAAPIVALPTTSADVQVFLLVKVDRPGEGDPNRPTGVRAVIVVPGSEKIEKGLTEEYWKYFERWARAGTAR
jgi:hypothetical protein